MSRQNVNNKNKGGIKSGQYNSAVGRKTKNYTQSYVAQKAHILVLLCFGYF